MNIHQLLSASQSSPQTQSQGAFSRQDSTSSFFHQALAQASNTQRFSASAPIVKEAASSQTPAPSQSTSLSIISDLASGMPDVDLENLSAALEALGLGVTESDLSELLAQRQPPSSDINVDTLGLNGAEYSTPLDDIAARLALMASFTEGTPQAHTDSPIDPAALPIDPAVLEAITEQLNINQTEAAQLVSALHVLVSQHQGTQPLPTDMARFANTNTNTRTAEILAATKPQPDTFFVQPNTAFAQTSTDGDTSQISSEALMGALLALEGAPKGSQSSEHLLTGGVLATGSSPLASAQPAQGFSPAVTPTQATLTTPVTSPAWPQQLGQQLVQISQRGGEQHVQMQLHPAELGPLSISLKFGEQGAQAHFLSAHAQVRQVLEQAIPQLREALAEQGISLGETSVSEQHDPNAQAFAQSGGNQGSKADSNSGDLDSDETPILGANSNPLTLDGRVDLYA